MKWNDEAADRKRKPWHLDTWRPAKCRCGMRATEEYTGEPEDKERKVYGRCDVGHEWERVEINDGTNFGNLT